MTVLLFSLGLRCSLFQDLPATRFLKQEEMILKPDKCRWFGTNACSRGPQKRFAMGSVDDSISSLLQTWLAALPAAGCHSRTTRPGTANLGKASRRGNDAQPEV